jgi:hypothetical protein
MIGDERGADIRTSAAAVFQQEQRDLAQTGEVAVDDGATTALAAYQTGVRENAQMRRHGVLRHSHVARQFARRNAFRLSRHE